MTARDRITLVIKILLPFFLVYLLNISPIPFFIIPAFQSIQSAQPNHQTRNILSDLRSIVALEPWRGNTWEEIGEREFEKGNPQQAIEAFQNAHRSESLSSQGLLSLGDSFLQSGNSEAAINTWENLKSNPQYFSEAYKRILHVQRSQGDFSAEANTLHSWFEKQPTDSQSAFRLGLLLSNTQPTDAVRYLRMAGDLDPGLSDNIETLQQVIATHAAAQPESYYQVILGRALGKIGEWDLAANAFKTATVLSPDYAEAWAFWGEAKQQLGMNGLSELKHAEALNPQSSLIRSLLSLYWRRQGDIGTSIAYLFMVANREPQEPTWQIELGNLLSFSGNTTLALYHYQKAVEIQPSNPVFWQALASFCADNDMEVRSIGLPAARKAVELNPLAPDYLTTMGYLLFKLGDMASSENFLHRALKIDSRSAQAYLTLGQLYLELNQRQAAFYHLSRAASFSQEKSSTGTLARRLLKVHFGAEG